MINNICLTFINYQWKLDQHTFESFSWCVSMSRCDSLPYSPGMYKNIDPVKRRILYEHSFGGKVRMKLGVQIKCTKRNNDVCELCCEKPTGDYWHLNNRVFLCRPCMLEERRKLSKHTRLELQEFRVRLSSILKKLFGTILSSVCQTKKTKFLWIDAILCGCRNCVIAQRSICTMVRMRRYG